MKSFMDVESIPTIPHLIEEVPDFKTFISGACLDGAKRLVGHTKPQQLKFFLDSEGTPVMKYKMYCTDVEWLGDGDRGIKMWKEDLEGRSLWPRGEPSPVPLKEMKGVEDIGKGISGFIKYWENMCNADHTGEYRRRFEHVVHYWQDVKAVLEEPFPAFSVLKDGFWPATRVQPTLEDQFNDDGKEREEFGEDEAYVGPLRERPQPSFRVGRDLHEGSFVAIRPTDGETQPVWFARALSGVNSNAEHPNCIRIQYLVPLPRIKTFDTSTLVGIPREVFVSRLTFRSHLCGKRLMQL